MTTEDKILMGQCFNLIVPSYVKDDLLLDVKELAKMEKEIDLIFCKLRIIRNDKREELANE